MLINQKTLKEIFSKVKPAMSQFLKFNYNLTMELLVESILPYKDYYKKYRFNFLAKTLLLIVIKNSLQG